MLGRENRVNHRNMANSFSKSCIPPSLFAAQFDQHFQLKIETIYEPLILPLTLFLKRVVIEHDYYVSYLKA